MPQPFEDRSASAQAALDHADRVLHGVACGARCAGYLAVVLLARHQQWFADLMTGVLLGDVVTWAMAAARDVRAHPRAVLAEGVAYALVLAVWFWLGGAFVTADLEQRALSMLGFFGTFTLKTAWFVWTVTHGRRD
jgi:hypothetical protein